MKTNKSIEEIAKEVEKEFGMGGLSSGLYFDFAKEVAERYATKALQTQEAEAYKRGYKDRDKEKTEELQIKFNNS